MSAITGVVRNGQIVLDNPMELPDGCRVSVEPIPSEESFGVCEEDWLDTPEAIAAWLRWYDTLEPVQLIPEKEGEWQAARQAQNEHEKAVFETRAEKLRRMWR